MALTDVAIRSLRGKPGEGDTAKPYKVSDSGGLYILVQPDGSRYWRLAYRFSGKQKTLALGVYPAVTLLEARKKRDAAKEQIKQGIDPSHSRKLEKPAAQVAAANSFESVAREWHENQLERWTPEHAGRTMRRLERDAFSAIGARPIAEIEAPELLIMLRRVEARAQHEGYKVQHLLGVGELPEPLVESGDELKAEESLEPGSTIRGSSIASRAIATTNGKVSMLRTFHKLLRRRVTADADDISNQSIFPSLEM